MKVLFISYYFDPFPGVGAKRTSYWFKNAAQQGLDIDVVTATEQDGKNERIIFLKPIPTGALLEKVIKDPGLHWKKQLINYLGQIEKWEYDIVLFSGGPFMHFGVGAFLKQKFNAKIVLDYRDPFGYNPRHQDSWMKKTIKTFFEKRFNKMATVVTTVNEICKADMTYSEKVVVIPNGFDDSVFKASNFNNETQNGVILNGGKLYNDFKMTPLLNVVKNQDDLFFQQVGKEYDNLKNKKQEGITCEGFILYEELLKRIDQAEICTVLTGGEPFETPTKTYDYIALNKKILVITEGEIKTGGIQAILNDYPNVAWSKNDEVSIKAAIDKLQKQKEITFDSYPFSRESGLRKLVDLFKTL